MENIVEDANRWPELIHLGALMTGTLERSRWRARETGASRYIDSEPCYKGHRLRVDVGAVRITSTGRCFQCEVERLARRDAKRTERVKRAREG